MLTVIAVMALGAVVPDCNEPKKCLCDCSCPDVLHPQQGKVLTIKSGDNLVDKLTDAFMTPIDGKNVTYVRAFVEADTYKLDRVMWLYPRVPPGDTLHFWRLELVGAGKESTFIDGSSSKQPLFWMPAFSCLSLNDVTLQNGFVNETGIRGVTKHNPTSRGGAIYMGKRTKLDTQSVIFANNQAVARSYTTDAIGGGAVAMQDDDAQCWFTARDTTFVQNVAKCDTCTTAGFGAFGGAVWASNCHLDHHNTRYEDNQADFQGTAIQIMAGKAASPKYSLLNLSGVVFTGQRSRLQPDISTQTAALFAKEIGTYSGATGVDTPLKDVHFQNNFVKGLQIAGQSEQQWTIDGGSFINNTDWSGGALSVLGTATKINLTNLEFKSNRAREGGAVYLKVPEADISSSSFTANVAKVRGGAVYVCSGTHLSAQTSTFEENVAQTQNGGAICIASEQTDLKQNSFVGNRAKLKGGAVYAEGLSLRLVGPGSVANNSAGQSGGGISMRYTDRADTGRIGMLAVARYSLKDNMAAESGGALEVDSCDLHITDSSLSANTLSGDAGSGAAILHRTSPGKPLNLQVLDCPDPTAIQADETHGTAAHCTDERCQLVDSPTLYCLCPCSTVNNTVRRWHAANRALITTTTITHNFMDCKAGTGGAISISNVDLFLVRSTLAFNHAPLFGGALFVDRGTASVSLEDTETFGNTAGQGAQIYHVSGGSVAFQGSIGTNVTLGVDRAEIAILSGGELTTGRGSFFKCSPGEC
jgi:predicted outer membrane repeat protein